jgi:hypothetical protein
MRVERQRAPRRTTTSPFPRNATRATARDAHIQSMPTTALTHHHPHDDRYARTRVRRLGTAVAAAAALVLAACGDAATAPEEPAAPQPLVLARFATLEEARGSAQPSTGQQRAVITTATAWQTFWAGLLPDPRAGGTPAAVDFSREMVIAAVMPLQPSAGASLDIETVTEHADHIEAVVVERRPAADCISATVITRPFDVVRVARRDKPVRFVERTAVASCGTASAPPVVVGDTVRAPVGRAVDAGNGTRITLVRVVEDSRCPMNALCIWEGSASVVLRFERAGAATVDTTLHTNARMGATALAFGGAQYTLFGLTPFRVVGQDAPKPEEYTAWIAVRR